MLSFAAYRQSLDNSWEVGTIVNADLHRYPGGSLRCLSSRRDEPRPVADEVTGVSIAEVCTEIGYALAAEPWLEHIPVTVTAAPAMADRRWLLGDDSGSLPMIARPVARGVVLAASDGAPVTLTAEWTPHGLLPLTIHLADRAIDVGPRADPSFVGAA
jgi:hypothetical protein